ncbi:hypothetical protein H0H92_003252 [Tricholoma furcatifolium]|nr:hypothetical protein H0H92_003252 [Tricholoma furcatifolium]
MSLAIVPLSGEEIRRAASESFIILKQHGFQACLVGGAACAMYGMKHREPNDVDIVVITEKDPEEIKRLISNSNHNFYLVSSTNPRNTYKILWFRLSVGRSCKVDILVPGILSIPKIPAERRLCVKNFRNIPLAPFLVVLLLKLRAWTDHRVDRRSRMRLKAPIDVRDIEELLEIGVNVYKVHLDKEL